MNKLLLVFISIFMCSSVLIAQIDIAVARGMSEGTTVTVQGIVTNGDGLGIIRYMEDATGAIAAYPGSGSQAGFADNVQEGDLIEVTGEISPFNGLLEISPITSYTIISSGNPLPEPLQISPSGINEANESKLVQVNNVVFEQGGSVFASSTYTISNGEETSQIYVRNGHPLIGTPIPLASVNLTGISSEFNGLYQLLLRDESDIEIADDFYLTSPPVQSGITTSGFTVSWTTNVAGSSGLRYGLTTAMENEIPLSGSTTDHSITLDALDAASFYYVEVFSDNATSTATSNTQLYSTASTSLGYIQIYFTQGVDNSFSTGSYADGGTGAVLEAAIISKIDAATTSIDAALYNNNREPIVEALTNAHNRGVQVRYIMDNETANLALQNPSPPFPTFPGNQDGLMHDKFFVIDAGHNTNSWVIMGSTNITDNNIATDDNNMVFIQDFTLAKAYTLEFEEMWGSDGADPGIFNVKFGSEKTDNTPHLFNVNGVIIESYFSPSDNTTIAILNAVNTADDELQFAMLTFTKNELGAAVVDAHNAGVDIRGIIDNINDQGSEFQFLMDEGVNVTDDNQTTQTHHKYAIIDANTPDSDPQVITGSHNWSASAEDRNDENTLIFHSATIANLFLQEFEARWCEAMGNSNCNVTATNEHNSIEGLTANIFPNPAKSQTAISIDAENASDLTISLWDINGRLLQSTILTNIQGQHTETLHLNGLPSGNYLVSFTRNKEVMVRKLSVID